MAILEFSGIETEVDLAPLLADESMTRFQDDLVEFGVSREEAASLSEGLLIELIESLGSDYAKEMADRLQNMALFREELRTKYEAIRDTFSPDRPPVLELPPELSADAFNELFNKLETLMDEMQSPEEYLRDPRRAENVLQDVENAGNEEAQTPSDAGADDFGPSRVQAPPRIPRIVRRAQQAANDLVRRFPSSDQWKVSVRDAPRGGRPAVAQYERLRTIDPVFAGSALEPRFQGPGGIDFMPDGIEMNADGSFSFLDNKEAFIDATQESGYFAGEANRELRSRLERDASIAATLERGGANCNGWRYFTESADLADLMNRIVEEIRTSPGGEELAQFIEIVGPGQ